MSLYRKQIEQLVALQQVDHEIYNIKKNIKILPEKVAEKGKSFKIIAEQRSVITDKLEYLTNQEKRISAEIEEDNERIKESKAKMMLVVNTNEYHAVTREVDTLEKNNRSREEEKLILLEEIQHQKDLLSKIEIDYQATKQEFDEQKDKLQTQLDELNMKLDELMQRRKASLQDVPPPVLARYEFIRERLENPVIVPVSDSVCSGCNIAIPPQIFIELQKVQQILSCPNCQRLIYWENHFNDKSEEETDLSENESIKE